MLAHVYPLTLMNMEVESEPTMILIKGFVNFSFFSMIIIDFGSTHNMILTTFAKKLGLSLILIKHCLVLLSNSQSNSIDHCLANILVGIEGVDTIVDFEIWNEASCDFILGLAWLQQVDAWIAYKEGAIYGKFQKW
jgi:hypothetical protein